jgi:superfamily II DNA or RNA helicase
MIQLRPYQSKLVEEIRDAFKSGFNAVLNQLPTGGGKTIIFSYIALSTAKKDKKVLILTDREELLKQAGGTISKFGFNPAFIRAGSKFIDYRKKIFIGMSQTLRNRIKLKEWAEFIREDIDLIIIDEAHIQEFNYLFESGLLKGKRVLGFTATPLRTGKMRQLGMDYEKLIRGAEPRDLIDLGYLLNCDTYKFSAPDMKGVKINAITGDYSEDSMFQRYDNATFYQGLVSNYKKYAAGKKMIVFCCNIEHAIKTTIQLNESGFRAKFISGEKTKPKEVMATNLFDQDGKGEERADYERYKSRLRQYDFYVENHKKYSDSRAKIFKDFHDGNFEILVNVEIATKGFDEPTIDVVAVYRSTQSLTLWLQMLGRGSRLNENKESFTVFDFGGNVDRLGNYDDNRTWSLWHDAKKAGGGTPPLKECGFTLTEKPIKSSSDVVKGCRRLIMASLQLCPYCGFKYPEKKEAKEVELVLSEIKDEKGVSLAVKNFHEMNWDELDLYRELKKHKHAWLWRQLWIRGGENEIRKFSSHKKWNQSSTERAINYCKNIL